MKIRRRLIQLCLLGSLLLDWTASVQAQFTFTTNNGAITITGYTGAGGSIVIPNSINNYPVAEIGDLAFYESYNLTGVVIPDSVLKIGDSVFSYCTGLTNLTIPGHVAGIGNYAFHYCSGLKSVTIGGGTTSIGDYAFSDCVSLNGITIPGSITNIGNGAFNNCYNLTDITIPNRVTRIGNFVFINCIALANIKIPDCVVSIGDCAFQNCFALTNITIPISVNYIGIWAFANCPKLTGIYFHGNAPVLGGSSVLDGSPSAVVYYMPGTAGWEDFFAFTVYSGAFWHLPYPTILNFEPDFGVQTNAFGFTISWATNIPVVVDACMNLSNPDWQPVQTNTLTTGSAYFSDPQWTNYPSRFYRLRSP